MTVFAVIRFAHRARARGLILAAALLALVCPLGLLTGSTASGKSPTRPARVPFGFFGTVLGGPLFPDMRSDPRFTNQIDLMVASGVESVRAGFDWAQAQPYQSWQQVPSSERSQFSSDGIDNVPTNFGPLDALIASTSARGLTVLPMIFDAPGWDGQLYQGAAMDIPRRDAPYAAFCAALVKRYGPRGTLWSQHAPRLPITTWQIWNEPDVATFWGQRPFAPRYIGLLRAARTAIRRQDPNAKIALAGLANYSWKDLRAIYAVPGARPLFDIVSLHPYTKRPQNVMTILAYARQIMRGAGDAAKPMIADEISWPSSLGKTSHDTGYDFATTEAGQARNVSQLLPLLAANRTRLGLIGVYWFTWATVEVPNGFAFAYSGLLKYVHNAFLRKPVFYAFRHFSLAFERCNAKGAVATVCLEPK